MKEDIFRPKKIKGDNYLCETGVLRDFNIAL